MNPPNPTPEPPKEMHIFGGGLTNHIANHFAISAPAYGYTASQLARLAVAQEVPMKTIVHYSKMCGANYNAVLPSSSIHTETPLYESTLQFQQRLTSVINNPRTKVVFITNAVPDYEVTSIDTYLPLGSKFVHAANIIGSSIGKPEKTYRFNSRAASMIRITCHTSDKIVGSVRAIRKDIFLVCFKTTVNASDQEMYDVGLRLCKEASCNLVLVNDTVTRNNMIITPEEAVYCVTTNRAHVLGELMRMTINRSQLTFTRSTVIEGTAVPWDSELVPANLRAVVDYCIAGDAYKPFLGATVGHFAVQLSPTEFLTSIRRSNFNNLDTTGLVKVVTDGPDTVYAYGHKPSVGGQSQRQVFHDHAGYDCIVHFHCPLLENPRDAIPVVSQQMIECGSHECGRNTSSGLKQFGNLKAVMLDNHGPNILFNKAIDPAEVISFINNNFDLAKKTGGFIPSSGHS